MSGGEFVTWMAYDEIAPLDSNKRLEAMIARLIAVTVNLHSKKKVKPKKFMPRYGRRRVQTPEQMVASLDLMYRNMR